MLKQNQLTLELKTEHNEYLEESHEPVKILEFAPLVITLEKYAEVRTFLNNHFLHVKMLDKSMLGDSKE